MGTLTHSCPCGFRYESPEGGPVDWDLIDNHPIEHPDACHNCGGMKCMGCAFREYDHDCTDDCPMCCA